LILAGDVRVNGRVATKAGTAVAGDAEVTLTSPDHPYVGRGGLKLAHALDVFGIDLTGRPGLDIGASTGGFTDVMLQRGAARIVALDVGHGQLDWKIRSDSRVVTMERVNARSLTPADLPDDLRTFGIVTIDVSFISLRHILPVVPPLLQPGADVVALVKPQFEARREEVGKGGIIRDEAVHARVIEEVTAAADALGLARSGLIDSPITGMEGNREFLLHLRSGTTSWRI
jgi:23S rRNA (cytidine1920-2'-O)/16S rRNA (cytidine1409-2'-O)-methyltransferase